MNVGERVRVRDKDGVSFCTVRFRGAVDGKAGEWIGVEWDDAARGRNDGSIAGKAYFTCKHAADAGSFIKAEKVKPGISLVEAVQERYTLHIGSGVVRTPNGKPSPSIHAWYTRTPQCPARIHLKQGQVCKHSYAHARCV